MHSFDFQAPRSLEQALSLLAQAGGQARPLAGGTDLIVQMKQGSQSPSLLVDVKGVPELGILEFRDGEGLRIGATVPLATVADFPPVREKFSMLGQACSAIGSVQVRNRGTVGGNLCNAAPSADTAPALICLDARAVIAGPAGRRQVAVEDFFRGPGETVLAQGELLVEIMVPEPPAPGAGSYLTFTTREEMDISIVGVGVFLALTPGSRHCQQARIALAAVAPTPLRAREAEAALGGATLEESVIEEAVQRASQAAQPISDVRGSAEYRRHLVQLLTRRAIQACLRELGD